MAARVWRPSSRVRRFTAACRALRRRVRSFGDTLDICPVYRKGAMPYHQGSEARIAYEQSGTGPDVVWVAGGGSRGIDWRRFQTPAFDGRYRSTTFDSRGIGDTECDLPGPWPLESFARDVAELVEAVCEPPVA